MSSSGASLTTGDVSFQFGLLRCRRTGCQPGYLQTRFPSRRTNLPKLLCVTQIPRKPSRRQEYARAQIPIAPQLTAASAPAISCLGAFWPPEW
jgi:hypothetical protein